MIEIYVATHKPINIKFPTYCIPIQVNAAKNGQWRDYRHDNDSPDNISLKNSSYCELTALYEMWKSCNAEIQGLFHYRRFFTGRCDINIVNETLVSGAGKRSSKWAVNNIISEQEIKNYLEEADVITAISNMPYPFTAYEDLQRFVYVKDIQTMIDIVIKLYPECKQALFETLNSTNISYCNMFIARKEFVDTYCRWLFSILAEIEPLIPIDTYDTNHQRIFGYYAEVLMNVYIRYNQLRSKEVYIVGVEDRTGLSGLKQKIRQLANAVLSHVSIYPLSPYRSLWQIRYERMIKREQLPVLRSAKEAFEWMKGHGFTDISEKNGIVKGSAGAVKLLACQDIDSARIESQENKFGYATIYTEYGKNREIGCK